MPNSPQGHPQEGKAVLNPPNPYDVDQLKALAGTKKVVTVWFSAQVGLKGTIESVARYTFTMAVTEKISPNGNYRIGGTVGERLCLGNKANYWFIEPW